MSVREAGLKKWGADFVRAVERTAGCHSELSSGRPPQDEEGRFVWGLLEAVDFDCPQYGWDCPGRRGSLTALQPVSLEEIRAFLFEHRRTVRAMPLEITSCLGVLAGTFEFLVNPQDGEE